MYAPGTGRIEDHPVSLDGRMKMVLSPVSLDISEQTGKKSLTTKSTEKSKHCGSANKLTETEFIIKKGGVHTLQNPTLVLILAKYSLL